MPRARTWNLRFNLDEFNAAFAALADDVERGQFMSGMSRGFNAGAARDGVSVAYSEGYAFGSSVRAETEDFRAMKQSVGSLGGRPKKEEKPIGSPLVNQTITKSEPLGEPKVNQDVTLTINHNPRTKKPRASKPSIEDPAKSETLESILGGKGSETWEAYWKLVAVFGPAKNLAPKASAVAYKASLEHSSSQDTQARAEALLKATNDPKYLPQLVKWLEAQGYLNPDATTRATHNAPTHRRTGTDDAYIRQLESRAGRSDVPEVRGIVFDPEEPAFGKVL